MDLSEAFWLAFVGGGFAMVGLIVRYSYKSKCKNISCCCLRIERDIEDELKEDLEAMKHKGDESPKIPGSI
jgi:hypothetical protein